MKNLIPFVKFSMISLLILVQCLFAQQDQYKRKSITFVDYILYQGVKESNKVTADIEYQYLRKIKNQLNLDRFDINNVPDKISRTLRTTSVQFPVWQMKECKRPWNHIFYRK